jgi:hypothetical protein
LQRWGGRLEEMLTGGLRPGLKVALLGTGYIGLETATSNV